MQQTVMINNLTIDAFHFHHDIVVKDGKQLQKVSFDFQVTSTDYHNVTTALDANDFSVSVPVKNLDFSAVIDNYGSSITDVYDEGNLRVFHLELIEKRRDQNSMECGGVMDVISQDRDTSGSAVWYISSRSIHTRRIRFIHSRQCDRHGFTVCFAYDE